MAIRRPISLIDLPQSLGDDVADPVCDTSKRSTRPQPLVSAVTGCSSGASDRDNTDALGVARLGFEEHTPSVSIALQRLPSFTLPLLCFSK